MPGKLKKDEEIQQYEAETPAVRTVKIVGYMVFILVLSLTTFKAVSLYQKLSATHFAPAVEYTAAITRN